MARTLSAVAHETRGQLIGGDAAFATVGIDTRRLESGALFVAIAGEQFDGNDFLPDAHARGAAGALVSRPAGVPLPQVRVADTRQAFGQMARAWRANFSLPVIAVTGSNGKTTVKALTASILASGCRVCVTRGNLNNDLGVPLTLMGLSATHEALVIELGANHPGEIDYLSGLVRPTVASLPTPTRPIWKASARWRAWRPPRASCSITCRATARPSSTPTTRIARPGGPAAGRRRCSASVWAPVPTAPWRAPSPRGPQARSSRCGCPTGRPVRYGCRCRGGTTC